MREARWIWSALLVLSVAIPVGATESVETDTHRFSEVRNGIYLAQTTVPLFNSNSLVIVNDDDVVVVDSHVTPAKARDLIAAIAELTPKPVTALINSHYHWDHAHGNQVFDVPIIGHEYTRAKLAGAVLEEATYRRGIDGYRAALERMQEEIDAAESEEAAEEIRTRRSLLAAHVGDFDEITPTPPNVTLNDKLTLFRGSREIQIIFLGRAHTGGDVVVYFPQDKLVFTGDMAFAGPSFLGDGYVDDWPQTMENLKALDFDIFVPGHGPPVTDLGRIDLVQAYYVDLWAKTKALFDSGVSAEDAAKTVDLTNHTEIPIQNVGADPIAVARIYERLENPD